MRGKETIQARSALEVLVLDVCWLENDLAVFFGVSSEFLLQNWPFPTPPLSEKRKASWAWSPPTSILWMIPTDQAAWWVFSGSSIMQSPLNGIKLNATTSSRWERLIHWKTFSVPKSQNQNQNQNQNHYGKLGMMKESWPSLGIPSFGIQWQVLIAGKIFECRQLVRWRLGLLFRRLFRHTRFDWTGTHSSNVIPAYFRGRIWVDLSFIRENLMMLQNTRVRTT